jgi:hypothetical protein
MEIAFVLNLTVSRVSQIHSKALTKAPVAHRGIHDGTNARESEGRP